jgi:DNA polymerase elongation subunit (family B)
MPVLEAWLFDAYPEEKGMRVWAIDENGNHHDFLDPWEASFYAEGIPGQSVERTELFSGERKNVAVVRASPLKRDALARQLAASGVAVYSADVHLVQLYHYDRGHFPLAFCRFEVRDGILAGWELRDDCWAPDYALPGLRTLRLSMSGSEIAGGVDPNHGARGRITIASEGRTRELEGSNEDQLESLRSVLLREDPDVIATDWGDSFLIPRLDELSRRSGIVLPFSRDPAKRIASQGERSFMTYGRTIYQGGAKYFFGRWHLDLKNSFISDKSGLHGLYEIARIAAIPVQRAARCTIGTSLSSMQMGWAWRNEVLIPMEKAQAEDFRPATDLLIADKGGLVYEPDIGWHESVAEYDFTSMYPEMMVRHNISPETVNCPCCPGNTVPEIGHHMCQKRRGLVPSVLEPILLKRAEYKKRAKAKGEGWALDKARADAHKWTLVCCFGYLGFKNARFGKIEAHEAVNAWGREVLLRAKESVEARGQSLLHAFVDALWFKVEPGLDLEELRLTVEKEAGCPLALEGVYKWLRFCPSRMDARRGVPARYFGAFQDGTLKIRGLACRRHDTPPLLKELQGDLLARLAQADDLAGCRAAVPDLLALVEEARARLREGRVTAEELAITFTLSKSPDEYGTTSAQGLVAKSLAAAGVTLHPGETVRYVIADAKDPVKEWRALPLALMEHGLDYDPAKYLELLDRAAWEILEGLTPDWRARKKAARPSPQLELFT